MATTTSKTKKRSGGSATTKRKTDAAHQRGSTNRCWRGYVPVAGKRPHSQGSCRKAPKGVNGSSGTKA